MRASIFRDTALANAPLGGQAVAAPDESARDLTTADAEFDFTTFARWSGARFPQSPRFGLANELLIRLRRHTRDLGVVKSLVGLERFIKQHGFPPQLQGAAPAVWHLFSNWAAVNAARVDDEGDD
jgi:hypothetical protein